MKFNRYFAAFLLLAGMFFSACQGIIPEIPDGPGPKPQDSTQVADTVDWSVIDVPAGAITVAEARTIAAALADGAATQETYYVKGIIKKFGNKHADGMANYGNAIFYMVDQQGDADDFEAYQVYGKNKQKFTSEAQLAVGDLVVVCCHITNYGGTYETVGKGDGYVYSCSNPNFDQAGPSVQPSDATPVTIAEAIAIANGLNAGAQTTELYKITGTVDKVLTAAENIPTKYTNINLNVTDETGTIACYYTNYLNNQPFTSADQIPAVGATVEIIGNIKSYVKNDAVTPEIINGWFVSIDNTTERPIDTTEPNATHISVAQFLELPVGETYYELTGVISGTINTTYGNFDLVDETGSVYVYGLTSKFIAVGSTSNDKSYASLGLAAGDTVTLRGMRGDYQGKIEVVGAYFVSSNKGNGSTTGGNTEGTTPGVAAVTVNGNTIMLDFAANPLGLAADLEVKGTASYALGETGCTITFDGTGNTSSGTKVLSNQFRMYKSTTFTITAETGKNVTSIEFETAGTISGKDYSLTNMSVAAGGGQIEVNGDNGIWTGSTNAVTFTNNNQVRINKMTITVE